MARLILLGVASALPRAGSDSTALAFESGAGDLLLVDCGGSGVTRLLDAGCDPARVAAVFLTHTHPDHLGGFPQLAHGLAMLGRRAPLDVFGHVECLRAARSLLEVLESMPSAAGGEYDLVWNELPARAPADFCAAGFAARSIPVRHSRPTLGVVLRDGTSAAACSADTGPSGELAEAARGVALLVHELGRGEGEAGEFHTGPADLGALAARAGAAQLVIVHTVAVSWRARAAAIAAIRGAGFGGRIEFGEPLRAYRF